MKPTGIILNYVLSVSLLSVFNNSALALQAEKLNLQQAVVRSLESHPRLLSHDFWIKASEANIRQAGVGTQKRLLVEVEDFLGSGELNEFDSTETTISVTWVLERDLIRAKRNVATNLRQKKELEKSVLRLDIASDAAKKFFMALRFQEELRLAQEWLATEETVHESIEKYVRSGKLKATDEYLSLVSLAQSRLVVEDYEHEIKTAQMYLSSTWGDTSGSLMELDGNIAAVSQLPSFQNLKKKIYSSPYVENFLSDERIKQAEIAAVTAQSRSRPTINAGVRHFASQDDVGLVASVSLPLGGRKRMAGRIEQLLSEQTAYRREATAERLKAEAVLFEFYEAYDHDVHVITVLEDEIIPLLKKAAAEGKEAYEQGKATYQDWSAVRRELFESKISLIELYFSAHTNRIEVERLTATPFYRVDNESSDEAFAAPEVNK